MNAYLDHAGIGLVRRPALDAMHDALEGVLARGSGEYGALFAARNAARAAAARLLGAAVEEVALVPNTSSGLQLVADGVDWRPGEEIVVFDRDFPANVAPWQQLRRRRRVRLRWVQMRWGGYDLAEVADAIGPRTRLIAVSHVNFKTGFRIDLDAVCRLAAEVGALVCVDAVQGFGAMPLSVADTPVDFLAAGGQKWLSAPPGTGVFFCRAGRLDDLNGAGAGWFGYHGSENLLGRGEGHFSYQLPLRPSALRFEGAMPNLLGQVGLAAALGELEKVGIDAVSGRITALASRLRAELTERGYVILGPDVPAARSGIVSFTHPERPGADLVAALKAAGCEVSFPDGAVRLSPHHWTSDDEVSAVLEALP